MIETKTQAEFNYKDYLNKQIVFFDGVCNFCNKTVDLIWKNNPERTIYYSSLQSEFAAQFLNHFGIANTDLDTFYFFDGQNIYDRSKAVGYVLVRLNRNLYRILGKLILNTPKFLADFLYQLFARNRYWLTGKSDTCRVPTEKESAYFLE